MRLKGVGRSPLSVAKVGLFAVGPERDQVKEKKMGGAGREAKRINKTVKINRSVLVYYFVLFFIL